MAGDFGDFLLVRAGERRKNATTLYPDPTRCEWVFRFKQSLRCVGRTPDRLKRDFMLIDQTGNDSQFHELKEAEGRGSVDDRKITCADRNEDRG
jgi:predicted HAD superfamily hydrolase